MKADAIDDLVRLKRSHGGSVGEEHSRWEGDSAIGMQMSPSVCLLRVDSEMVVNFNHVCLVRCSYVLPSVGAAQKNRWLILAWWR